MRDHRGEYNEMDELYVHPVSGARLFLGNITASKNLEALESLRITHVVNTMARNTDADLQDRVAYFRFPGIHVSTVSFSVSTPARITQNFPIS